MPGPSLLRRTVLAAALMWAALAQAGPCADPGPHGPTNTLNWTASTPTGINATHWYVDQTVRMTAIDMYLRRNSAGISFVVYESLDDVTYTLIASTSANQGGTGWEWHASGPMDVLLQSGRWYAIGLHWTGTVTHSGSNAPAVTDLGWGTMIDGAYGASVGTPEASRTFAYGYWNPTQITVDDNVDDDGDGSLACQDCDDDDPDNYPGNTETCDGLDNDCDGVPDNGQAAEDFWPDVDMDGHGDPSGVPVQACGYTPPGTVANNDDCDDGDPNNFPTNPEVCDNADNDCDTVPDNGVADATWWPDVDGDGFGDPSGVSVATCGAPPSNHVDNDLDCDDGEAESWPGNPEVCDGIDNDCSGTIPVAEVDDDGDGYVECDPAAVPWRGPPSVTGGLDCDDTTPLISPAAADVCGNGLDDDCDGLGDHGPNAGVPGGYLDDDGDGIPWADESTAGTSDCNAPPTLVQGPLLVDEGDNAVVTPAQLAASDADNTAAELVYTVTAEPTEGGLFLVGSAVGLGGSFTQQDVVDGVLVYLHNGGELPSDAVDLDLQDPLGEGLSTTLLIDVAPINDAPVLVTTALSVLEGSSIALGAQNLVGTDAEDDPTTLVYELTAEPTSGYVDLGPAVLHPGSTVTWTELNDAKVVYHHDGSETTADAVGFRLVDIDGLQGPSAVLSIAITPLNDRPTANPDSYSCDSEGLDVGASTGVLANDVDAEGDTLSAVAVLQPLNGTLALNADGGFTYTPNAGFSGADQFTYTAADALDESQETPVSLTVTSDGSGGSSTAPEPKLGCGCSSSGSGSVGWWLVGIGALGVRRRR